MLLRIGSVDGVQHREVDVEQTDSFGMLGGRGAVEFGYHGNFSVRLPSGEVPRRSQNLEDNEEFMSLANEDGVIEQILPVVSVGTEG